MRMVQGFVDGGYLWERAKELGVDGLPNPLNAVGSAVRKSMVQSLAGGSAQRTAVLLGRVTYYDASPEHGDDVAPAREEYWNAIELLPDTHLGFGFLRGKKGRPRQKAVDTLLAVDMIVGAFTRIYDIAVLVAGDADFVPVVNEVRRRGPSVVVVACESSLSDELRRAVDRVIPIVPDPGPGMTPAANSVVLTPM